MVEVEFMERKSKFFLKRYYRTLTRMVGGPGQFFREKEAFPGGYHCLGFLVLSALVFTGVGLLFRVPDNPALIGGIALFNEVGMAVLAAAVGYGLMVMLVGRRAGFIQVFSVVALSSGTALVVSWVPYSLWIAVIWKWWLIATGLTAGIGLRKREAGVVVGLAVLILFGLFRSLLPLTMFLKASLV